MRCQVDKMDILAFVLALSLTGCASKPAEPTEPPKSPPIPNLTSPNGHIKAVGTLPEIQAYAQAYWTADDRLFVMGDTVGERVWEEYYRKQYPELAKWEGHIPERYTAKYSFLPVWDPKTNQSEPVRGYLHYRKNGMLPEQYCAQLVDKRVACYRRSLRDSMPTQGELYNPVVGSSALLPSIKLNFNSTIYSMPNGELLLQGLHYPYWTHDWTENQAALTANYIVLNPLTGNYKTLLDVYPGHSGAIGFFPDKKRMLVAGGSCFNKEMEKKLFQLSDWIALKQELAPCYAVGLIDTEQKKYKKVGTLLQKQENSKNFKLRLGYLKAIDNNRMLFVGGHYNDSTRDETQVGLFNMQTSKFKVIGSLGDSIENILQMSDGSIVILGNNLHLFDQKSEKLIDVDTLIMVRDHYGSAVSQDDEVYIAGGVTNVIEMFDYAKYKKEFLK